MDRQEKMKAKEGSENGSENGSNDDSDTEDKVCICIECRSVFERAISQNCKTVVVLLLAYVCVFIFP